MERVFDTLIVGGGVIGLSVARELARLGVKRVGLIERGKVGREASFAAAGLLAPNVETASDPDLYRLCSESCRMFPQLSRELIEETGFDIELQTDGTIFAAFNDDDSARIHARLAEMPAPDTHFDYLTSGDIRKIEPNISENVRDGIYFPDDWQVENRKLLLALEKSVSSYGVDIIEDTAVRSLTVERDRAIGVVSDRGTHAAGTVVLATGAWTSLIKIDPGLIGEMVRPIKGQMISYQRQTREFRRVIYTRRGYLVPRMDGRLLLGATVEDAGFDLKLTPVAASEMAALAVEIAPGLAGGSVTEHWAGLRPFAIGGRPIIGPVPGVNGAFLATGHFRNGILLAPITAKMLAGTIVNRVDLATFGNFGPGPNVLGAKSTII
ncbi:MAG TPA: glycine oxidase ThiO [Pyrinomonadaceae bacterium]|nr:glycine oxidase ThiO [Pyrinomonadaceae bacterium]